MTNDCNDLAGESAAGTSGRFRRVAIVTAVRLTEARSWTSDGENKLTVQAGDWWVTSPNGTERGVSEAVFPTLYEHVDGDRYRARGVVTARQVTEPELILTMEGQQTAKPGDWVVDDGTSQWPVPDAHFKASYAPEPRAAESPHPGDPEK